MSAPISNHPTVIVTGGTQGLGHALTAQLLQQGFAVALCARTKEDVAKVEQSLARQFPCLAQVGDVADPDFRRHLVQATVTRFGRLDAVVNNASTLGQLPLPYVLDSTADNDAHVFQVNVEAPMQLLREAWPYLRQARKSLVLGISSDAAIGGYPNWGIYGASKAALDLLHKTLAAELEEYGVQVHSFDPGDMHTAMHLAADPEATGLRDPSFVARALMSLFSPLVTRNSFAFRSGARLFVTSAGELEVAN